MVKQKKLFLVKREVWAYSIDRALKEKGKIYEIVESATPPIQSDALGFNNPVKAKIKKEVKKQINDNQKGE